MGAPLEVRRVSLKPREALIQHNQARAPEEVVQEGPVEEPPKLLDPSPWNPLVQRTEMEVPKVSAVEPVPALPRSSIGFTLIENKGTA